MVLVDRQYNDMSNSQNSYSLAGSFGKTGTTVGQANEGFLPSSYNAITARTLAAHAANQFDGLTTEKGREVYNSLNGAATDIRDFNHGYNTACNGLLLDASKIQQSVIGSYYGF